MVILNKAKLILIPLLSGLIFITPALALEVVTTIQPIHSLTASIVAGTETQAHRLLKPGHSPHFFSLKPSDRRQIARADLIIWIGPELEQVLTSVMSRLPHSKQLQLMSLPDIHILPYRAHSHHEDEHHEHTHTHTDDPHIWLNIDNAITMAKAICHQLSELDKNNQATYKENTIKLIKKLRTLKSELKESFSHVGAINYLVYHDAYQYFEKQFNLSSPVVVNENPHIPLSVKQINALRKKISQNPLTCVYTEPEFSSKFINALKKENMHHFQLDPLGANTPMGPSAYFIIMRKLASQFSTCYTITESKE